MRRLWIGFAAVALLTGLLSIASTCWHTLHGASASPLETRVADSDDVSLAQADELRPPPPGTDDAVDKLLTAVTVDGPITHKRLSLFTVSLRQAPEDFVPRTFDDAVESGDLVVQEVRGGEVNTVRVRNRGSRPVFIMAGEIMSGSKQDRTAQRDVLIPAYSDWIEIPVYCVEAGRWALTTPQFGTRRALASPGLRERAYSQAEQSAIWSEVDRTASTQGVAQSAAKAFQEIYDSDGVRQRVEDYLRGLPIPRDERLVGFVACAGEEIIGADVFAHPELFGQLREKLIRSYVLAIPVIHDDRWEAMTLRQAALFLARAWSENCTRTPVDTPGIGQFYRLNPRSHAATTGGALVYRGAAVHLSLFQQRNREPVPVPRPEPVPIPRPMGGG